MIDGIDVHPARLVEQLEDLRQYARASHFRQLALLVVARTLKPGELTEVNFLCFGLLFYHLLEFTHRNFQVGGCVG